LQRRRRTLFSIYPIHLFITTTALRLIGRIGGIVIGIRVPIWGLSSSSSSPPTKKEAERAETGADNDFSTVLKGSEM